MRDGVAVTGERVAPSRHVAVFCGSKLGHAPVHREAAVALGRGLAEAGIGLVYGGGSIGLMGVLADAVLAQGGQVIGVIPEFLARLEVAHAGLTRLEVTDSMHSRKRRMFELADAFITMSGGVGTLDETVEIITWKQLRLHAKPVLICNVAGWADGLLAALRAVVADGFASAETGELYEVMGGVAEVLVRLEGVGHRPGVPASRM